MKIWHIGFIYLWAKEDGGYVSLSNGVEAEEGSVIESEGPLDRLAETKAKVLLRGENNKMAEEFHKQELNLRHFNLRFSRAKTSFLLTSNFSFVSVRLSYWGAYATCSLFPRKTDSSNFLFANLSPKLCLWFQRRGIRYAYR